MIHNGPSIKVSTASYNSTTKITTFTCSEAHGLVVGNAFRIIDSSNNNLGDYIVSDAATTTQFTAKTSVDVSTSTYVLKHALSANSATADGLGENLGTRGLPVYGKEVAILGNVLTTGSNFQVSLKNSGIGTTRRFELGSYIQIDNEIMRITSSTLSGAGNNEINVIRGSMGTLAENHPSGSLIRKIKLTPIQFHRPSILRASGHTFEYLGYGPGNYSTGLPQVQVKTITEREDFLAQSQETSCGNVIYTGMNSNGDVFNGNTKTSAASGQVVSYDIPKPTVTGEDPNRLSVVFDEVIVKERLLVEGGNSGTILSQFNGPITFNGEVRLNRDISIKSNIRASGTIKSTNDLDSTSCTTGALTVAGGVGIAKNLNVCGSVGISAGTNASSTTTGALIVSGGVGIAKKLYVGENTYLQSTLDVTGAATFQDNVSLKNDKYLNIGNSNEFTIRYNGTSSFIKHNNSSGRLKHAADFIQLTNKDDNETLAQFIANDKVELFYDNGSRFETTSSGVQVYGAMSATGALSGSSLTVSGTITASSVSVSGDIRADGDITAFASDIRLKENINPIENALDKVLSLRGFTYNFNETGKNLGYDPSVSHAGVSAQEVQRVLPEAVVPAPVDSNYLSVKYDKLVPLLIEAIKELKQEIEDLKNNK